MKIAFFFVSLALAFAGCNKLETQAEVYGFNPDDVRFEMTELGLLNETQRQALMKEPDVDGHAFLNADNCDGQECRVVELKVFVYNPSSEAIAPPVLRLKSPTSRAARLPVASRIKEVLAKRRVKIRWLVSLWPEEEKLEVSLTPSVFIDL